MLKKKRLLTVLAISCVVSMAIPSYADVNTGKNYQGVASNDTTTAEKVGTGSITDISNHWAKANIEKLVALNAINGYEDGTFKPNQTITRAEFLKISMLAVDPTIDTTAEEGSHWCSGILKVAYEKQVLYDYDMSSSSEDLDQPITRNEMARILVRINKLMQKETDVSVAGIENILTDYQTYETPNSPSEYLPYVATAYIKGLLSGYSDGSFYGDRLGTRAEATTMILRLLDKNSRVAVDTTKLQNITTIMNAKGQMVQTAVKKYCYEAFSQTKIYNQEGRYYVSINLPSLPSGFLWRSHLICSTKEGILIYDSYLDSDASIKVGATGSQIYEVKGLTTEQVKGGAGIGFYLYIITPTYNAGTVYYGIETSLHGKIYEDSSEIGTDARIDYDTSNIFNSADWTEEGEN